MVDSAGSDKGRIEIFYMISGHYNDLITAGRNTVQSI